MQTTPKSSLQELCPDQRLQPGCQSILPLPPQILPNVMNRQLLVVAESFKVLEDAADFHRIVRVPIEKEPGVDLLFPGRYMIEEIPAMEDIE